ncbi:MAG: bifunctional folylpolyglutamate synthase/dihydrofolate synthase [Clostridiales bacterium]|nr:bifunctional folylpolyglutamate synthase/dihydrofolate synthase [Clostridiales bacterium]
MDYREARAFVDGLQGRGGPLGLEAISNLLQFLGDPQEELRVIHVAGTNGKGSVIAYLAAVLETAGYRVGRYVSPTLFSYREQIQLNGENISREDFAEQITKIAAAMETMRAEGMQLPSMFEAETAAAFLYFQEQKCDFVLLETGMGGRTDATNVIRKPVLSVLASISMDHMEYLGSTLGEIAWNKAGIFKEGVPVVSTEQEEEAAAVIRDEARKKKCPVTFVGRDFIKELSHDLDGQSFSYEPFGIVTIRLAGRHQRENAALALECVGALRKQGYLISETALKEGMRTASWKGRFSVIHKNPIVVLDGAHNPDAAARLRDAILDYFPDRKKYYIMGVFSDKEYDKIIDKTADLAEHIITIETPDNPRALPAEALARAVQRVNPSAEAAGSIAEAVDRSFALAGPEDVILIFGSLSFLGEAEQAVRNLDEIKDDKS